MRSKWGIVVMVIAIVAAVTGVLVMSGCPPQTPDAEDPGMIDEPPPPPPDEEEMMQEEMEGEAEEAEEAEEAAPAEGEDMGDGAEEMMDDADAGDEATEGEVPPEEPPAEEVE